jgi:hypothetical protein
MNVTSKVNANVKIQLMGPDGNEKDTREVHNTMMRQGCLAVSEMLLASTSYVKPGWMDIGTGTAITGTDSLTAITATLGTAVGSARPTCTKTRTASTANLVCVSTWGVGVGTDTIQEAGLFSSLTTIGTYTPKYAWATFAPIVKAAGDTLTITWTITVA